MIRVRDGSGRHRCRPVVLATLLIHLAGPLHGQDVPFPIEQFQGNDTTARWLLAYDRCAWRSSDELVKQPREALDGLGPVWMCLEEDGTWHALYGRFDEAAERYTVRFHYQVARSSVSLSSAPLDSARMTAAARALAAAVGSLPDAFRRSGARFNSYVQFRGESGLSVWILPAWQPNGVALFGAEARYDYSADGSTRVGQHVIPGPLRGTRPDTAVAFRIDSNGSDAPTVGDLFFHYLMRPYFASMRILTPRYSSSIVRVADDEAWVHVVRPAVGDAER